MKFINRLNINGTIFIAVLPLIGYIAAYFYQLGYYSIFNIPEYLLKVSVETAIISTLFILVLAFSLGLLWFIVSKIPNSSNNKTEKPTRVASLLENIIICFVGILVISLLIFMTDGISVLIKILLPVFVSTLLILLIFLPPLFKFPEIKSYRDKFNMYSVYMNNKEIEEKKKKLEQEKKYHFILSLPADPTLFNLLMMSFCLFYVIGASYLVGLARVQETEEYYTFRRNETTYILFQQGDNQRIGVKLNPMKNKTEQEFITIPSDETIEFKREHLGKLNFTPQNKN